MTYIERAVGGVEARKYILERLIRGEASGIELKDYLEGKIGHISDTQVYYNIGRLVDAGIVRVKRRWREKVFEISPQWIQDVRMYLGLEVPLAYIGGFESEIPFRLKGRLRSFLGKDVDWFILLVKESMRDRVRLYGAESVYVDDSIWDGSVVGVAEPLRAIIEEKIKKYDLIVDVTHGTDVTKLALLQLAWEYNLKCIRYEKGRFIWLKV